MRIGSLCTGYGGLDMAATQVFGGQLAWSADNDRHAAALLAVRYGEVPNLGDITAIDWPQVESVEIVCAGFPCQDISYAGRGAGIKRGSRSGIWINIVAGIRLLKPKIVVVENVAALRRRGLDRVLGDLATLGYDAVWTSLRASDIGAAHRRERVFVLAYRGESNDLIAAADAGGQRWTGWPIASHAARRRPSGGFERSGPVVVPGLPAVANAAGRTRHFTTSAQSAWQPDAGGSTFASGGVADGPGVAWGRYEAAIRRWEAVIGRPAPAPTEPGTRGQTRLAARFSEWLMGLPEGFVTGLDLPYTAQHRLLGNGVVPQQATAALRLLVAIVAGPGDANVAA